MSEFEKLFKCYRTERFERECPMCSDLYHGYMAGSIDQHEKVSNLQKENQELVKILQDLVDDIYTPYRLGLDEEPNPEWSALKKAKKLLKTKGVGNEC